MAIPVHRAALPVRIRKDLGNFCSGFTDRRPLQHAQVFELVDRGFGRKRFLEISGCTGPDEPDDHFLAVGCGLHPIEEEPDGCQCGAGRSESQAAWYLLASFAGLLLRRRADWPGEGRASS